MPFGLFIDGAYAYRVMEKRKINFLALRKIIEESLDDTMDEGYYFNADDSQALAERLHNALTYQPPQGPGLRVKVYTMKKISLYWPDKTPVIHPTKHYQYELKVQKAVDVGLVYHMIRSYTKRHWDQLVLVAGDGDFHEPVQDLVEHEGVKLHIFGSINTISSGLRPYGKIYEMNKSPIMEQILLYPDDAETLRNENGDWDGGL